MQFVLVQSNYVCRCVFSVINSSFFLNFFRTQAYYNVRDIIKRHANLIDFMHVLVDRTVLVHELI